MSEITTIKRSPHKASYDQEAKARILQRAITAHVGIEIDGQPFVIPLLVAPYKEGLVLHGSTASRLFKHLATGAKACVSITLIDGLVVARSTFNSSMHYQSLMAFGSGYLLEGVEKESALMALSEHLMPGRLADLRESSEKEMKATSLIFFPLDEISIKISNYHPKDEPEDLDLEVWAGVLPMKTVYGDPIDAPDLKFDINAPEYLAAWPLR